MTNPHAVSNAGQQYAAAHTAHYVDRDLLGALELYKKVLASHPGTVEADFSHTQMQNIVHAVIPKQELMATQMELVFAHLRARRTGMAATPPEGPPTMDDPS